MQRREIHFDILDIILGKHDIGNNISNLGEILAHKNVTVKYFFFKFALIL